MGIDKKTYFAIADVHGFFTPMRRALDEAGFDPECPDHVLVCVGDMFDRGEQNLEMYRYMARLPRKILVRGNHEQRLLDILDQRYVQAYDYSNGTVDTLHQLFGIDCVANGGIFMTPDDDPVYLAVHRLLDATVPYYEKEDYIFTHGWLPLDDSVPPHVSAAWRDADEKAWRKAYWLEWQQLYRKVALPQGKTLVCGHRSASMGYWFDTGRAADDYSAFCGEGLIVLDACTVRSGRVNVLVLSDGSVTLH